MNSRTAGLATLTAALSVTATACASIGGGPQLRLPTPRPSALAIVGADLRGEAGLVRSLVAGSARPRENLEMIDAAFRAGNVVDPAASRAVPAIRGPAPPKALQPNPTQYQTDAHAHQVSAYHAKVAADLTALRVLLAGRMREWAARAGADLARLAPTGPASWDVRTGLRDAAGYFSSLQQAGVEVGPRRVVVVFWPAGHGDAVVPLRPQSLAGITVVLAGFPGGQREQAEWQADLLQAGAARAIVLVPGAIAELRPVVARALSGHAGPAPQTIRFGLNSARLDGRARSELTALASELLTAYRGAPATALGFADPIGGYRHNLRLSFLRALAVRHFLIAHGVAASRLFAVGYGPSLPVAPTAPDGAQPLDRRVVVVIDPAS